MSSVRLAVVLAVLVGMASVCWGAPYCKATCGMQWQPLPHWIYGEQGVCLCGADCTPGPGCETCGYTPYPYSPDALLVWPYEYEPCEGVGPRDCAGSYMAYAMVAKIEAYHFTCMRTQCCPNGGDCKFVGLQQTLVGTTYEYDYVRCQCMGGS